jgi:leucyl-tRNA---protein transferase
MFGKIQCPAQLSENQLDDYLSKGWFRMGQSIFTSHFLNFNRVFYNAIWLRIDLENFQPNSQFKKIIKLNSEFEYQIEQAEITNEKEELFQRYKTSVAFITSDSLSSLLMDGKQYSIFNTFEVTVRDKGKLIAVGFFDLGNTSTAGIVSVYDPDYKKNSLGKYLIFKKIEYSFSNGYKYFYPGYFAPGYKLFNYKLDLAENETEFYYSKNNSWKKYKNFGFENMMFERISSGLRLLEMALNKCNIPYQSRFYEYYNANNYPQFERQEMFDYPKFLFVGEKGNHIAVYNNLTEEYSLLTCVSFYENQNYVEQFPYYGYHVMKIHKEHFRNSDVNMFVSDIEKITKSNILQ